MNTSQEFNVVVASDVRGRDGVGVEVYAGEELVMEIFRNDATKTREVTLYKRDIPLELVEASIAHFRKAIPWDFVDSDRPD